MRTLGGQKFKKLISKFSTRFIFIVSDTTMKIERDVFFLIPIVGEKDSRGVKSRDLQKAHLGPLLNVHTQFRLPSSNLEVSYAKNKLKKKGKPDQETTFLGREGVKWG